MTRNLPPAPARRPKRGAHASLHPDLSPARTVFRPALLALAVAVATAGAPLPAAAASDGAAATAASDDAAPELDAITIYALPLGSDSAYTPASFDLLEGQELFERSDATLGTTLEGLPGVHADTFGGGSSRPVIRGQAAPRVSVLSDGATLFDASALSPDHAVTTDPLLAHRIEVLRGPSTLLYGGGAIGGVVNILDDKIPARMPEDGVDGVAVLRGNTVADERAGALGVTARAGERLALRLEGSLRDAEDYEVNGFTVPTIEGTFAESRTGTLGASWIDERGYIGIAITDRTDEYGLPGHSHDFEAARLTAPRWIAAGRATTTTTTTASTRLRTSISTISASMSAASTGIRCPGSSACACAGVAATISTPRTRPEWSARPSGTRATRRASSSSTRRWPAGAA